ncbi:MAG: aminopeptidase [Saprospiraceae bacterium]|nr:MAG: aminopeptidase [Saprospiraceae bacterium]
MHLTKSIFNQFLLIALLFLVACTAPATETETETEPQTKERTDSHSFALPDEAVTKHLSLHLKVDFQQKILSGFARYQIENQGAKQIVLDARGLNIEKVTLGEAETPTEFKLSKEVPILGSALSIDIQPDTRLLTIYYQTTPEGADAVDWLSPQQTADKKHPFLYTQGQAILTRTWIPCQDSPGIRITYDAQIEVPKALMAVMSATNPQEKNDTGIYTFKMEQPVPPYLMALAIGDIQFKSVGPRTGVYAEPGVLEKAAYEFGEMEDMLKVTETLYGPYRWERYDLIVLPPSFPFGGMENPRLTFATPTVIAGDRSLVSLIAHELAHSWSGNLVTNATWNDFWLNEGFTVYIERRIMEELYGEDYANMLAILGYQDLEADVADLEAEDTRLRLELEGRDPDEGMTDVAYEKGAYFLTLLEQKVGREKFDEFLKKYFDTYQFKTITTAEFVAYLKKNLLEPDNIEVNWEEWIYQPGIPANAPIPESDRFAKVEATITALQNSDPNQLKTSSWTTHEWLHFIRHLPKDLTIDQMAALDKTFQFSDSGNSEILDAWFEVAIRNGYAEKILPKIEAFLVNVGRRKFLTPLYRAFKESGQLDIAESIYKKAAPNYHAVSRGSIESLLDIK